MNIDVMNNVTDATSPVQTDENVSGNNVECVDGDDDSVLNLDDVACDKGQNVADAEQLALEQQHDKSLAMCFSLAKRGKAGYFIHDGILYRKEKQIQEMLAMGIIRPSKSDMASPIVCVLKGENLSLIHI